MKGFRTAESVTADLCDGRVEEQQTHVVHCQDDEEFCPSRSLIQDLPQRVLLVEELVGLCVDQMALRE